MSVTRVSQNKLSLSTIAFAWEDIKMHSAGMNECKGDTS